MHARPVTVTGVGFPLTEFITFQGMATFPNLAYQRGVLGVERGPFGDLAPTRCYIGPVPYRYPVVNLSKNLPMPLPIQQYPIPYIPPQNPVPFSFPPNQQLSNGYPAKVCGVGQ